MRKIGIVLALFVLAGVAAFAQSDAHEILIDITGVAALDLNDDTQITLSTTAPSLPGNPVTGTAEASKRLYYTLLTGGTQTIQASITAGTVPTALTTGTTVDVVATISNGSHGTTAGTVTLTGGAQDIITGIGSVATGRDPATAPVLTYTLQVDDPTLLVIGQSTITVTLTLTGP